MTPSRLLDCSAMAGMVVDWMRSVIRQYPQQAEERGLPRVVAAWDAGEERVCRGGPHIIVVHGDKDYGFEGLLPVRFSQQLFVQFADTGFGNRIRKHIAIGNSIFR